MEIREEPFQLTDNDANVTEADGTASTWSDIWDYEVPIGEAIRLTSEHTFSAYLENASAEVSNTTCSVRIEVRDPSGQDVVRIFGPALYIKVKEFSERPLLAHLGVAELTVRERQHIVVQANDDGAIDASDSYFQLHITRVRQALTS